MKLDPQTALLVVAMQNALYDDASELAPSGFETTALDLLSVWRGRSWPIYHYKFNDPDPVSPFHPGQPGNAFLEKTAPREGEDVIEGNTPCAFISTPLGSMLRMSACEKLVVCGGYLNHQVDQTLRHATALGFESALVPEATAAHSLKSADEEKTWSAQEVCDISLASLAHRTTHIIHMRDIFTHL